MSAPSSPPPSAAYVPYLPYKSKRHSRNLSNTYNFTPNQSPPPVGKSNHASNNTSASNSLLLPPQVTPDIEHNEANEDPFMTTSQFANPPSAVSVIADRPVESSNNSSHEIITSSPTPVDSDGENYGPAQMLTPSIMQVTLPTMSIQAPPRSSSLVVAAASASSSSAQPSTPKKTSTFRRLPAKNNRLAQSVIHERNASTTSLPPRLSESANGNTTLREQQLPLSSAPPSPASTGHGNVLPPATIQQSASHSSDASTTSTAQTLSTLPTSRRGSPILTSSAKPAPYRPGFQPKGVYRPLTDEFIARRRVIRDGDDQGGITRVERTKLERRLEKLIALHFSRMEMRKQDSDHENGLRPHTLSRDNRRASSFFDFQSLRELKIQDAGDLWRGVVKGGLGDTSKMDIRAAEQRITPWQNDAEVSKCPLCLTAFHPLTNRKHHCRLCGQIICSLPVTHPQRPMSCSILFVVDTHTRVIEEVGEGVDYGVKRRNAIVPGRQEDEDKFLKGVRICRQCRPILLQQQYHQQVRIVPPFVQIYENFILLEAEIEESLPKFQELLMTLTHHDQPTKEASVIRKRLLASFAQYDRLSKEIRALPCSNGPGSSQDRVQAAIMTRANLFLQKNMFPLQSLPTPNSGAKSPSEPVQDTGGKGPTLAPYDPDSALAHTLQPLLEQETLLESFVEEAQAQRKFEDVKSLKINLQEIRREINRIVTENRL